jgi:hypothetical protein
VRNLGVDPSPTQSSWRHRDITNSVTFHATLQHDISGRDIKGRATQRRRKDRRRLRLTNAPSRVGMDALRRGRVSREQPVGAKRPCDQLAAAVGATAQQCSLRARYAERTFERTDSCVCGSRRQVLITAFAIGSHFKHCYLRRDSRRARLLSGNERASQLTKEQGRAVTLISMLATRVALLCEYSLALEGLAMAQLIVRDLPAELVLALKRRAAKRNRSAEQEHREILKARSRGRSGGRWRLCWRRFQTWGRTATFGVSKAIVD